MRFLIRGDFTVVGERQSDVVESFEQALLREGIDLEARRPSEPIGNRLRGQVDRELIIVVALDCGENGVRLHGRENDRKDVILEAVIAEDIGERGRDYGLEAEVRQRPYGVLARTAAAEIGTRDEDRRLFEARLIQHELAVGLIAPVVKESGGESATYDRLEKLLRDDLVGVDVGTIHRRDHAGETFERL